MSTAFLNETKMKNQFYMAVLPCFLFLSALTVGISAQQQRNSNITPGSFLTPLKTSSSNSSWLSPSGLFAFGFYPLSNGHALGIFLVGIPEKSVVWTANRDDPVVTTDAVLRFADNGRLILEQQGRDDIIIANPQQGGAVSASMLDTGNFVLYSSSRSIMWQSFDYPTDTLLGSQGLAPETVIVSSVSATNPARGIFSLRMQSDGNLVQYTLDSPDTTYNAYYATNTNGAGSNVSLNLDNSGNLYLYNGTSVIRNLTIGSQRERTIYLVRLDVDGIFRLYFRSLDPRSNWNEEWSSTEDKCGPKGICGLNSYCTRVNEHVECKCLPGFDPVNPGNWTSGCERNFAMKICKENDQNIGYEIEYLDNMLWDEIANYGVLARMTREDCGKACLEDCNCDAALFSQDGNCKKQGLPLRYVRRSWGFSTIALIKTITTAPSSQGGLDISGKQSNRRTHLNILIVSISLLVFACLTWVITRIYFGRYKEYENVELVEDVGLRAFTYKELEQATHEFRDELGRGASAIVYKGILPNNRKLVAVKKLDKELKEGEMEFHSEMKVIGKTYHCNLVRLLGYCQEGSKWLLVYEYMKNGSLADILFTPENRPCWEERIRIARDIARGILYLHEECETQIIHCDIKPQNILMDEHMCAKISDFGLAKLLKEDQTKTYTGIRGTRGYVAPEWHKKLPVTVKADVYSFGIVLLEIICGRRSVDWSLSEDEAILEEWVYCCFEAGEITNLVRDEDIDKKKLDRMVKIGIWCLQDEASLRPSMKKVLLMLEGTVDIPIPPSPTSFLSAI